MPRRAPKPNRLLEPRRAVAVGIAVLIAITCAIYYPSLRGGFLLDDDLLLTQNKLVQSPDGLYRIWLTTEPTDYWPLTNSSFWLLWHSVGSNPLAYRLTNLVLHVVDVLLIWAVLARLSIPGAFLAALLFAVHPINVESVAWIAQLKNLLALLFFLLSVLWWLKGAMIAPVSSHNADNTENTWKFNRWYFFSLIAFLAAMLSKGSVAILPVVLLLIAWWQRGQITKADFTKITPFFVIAIGLTAVNIWFQSHDQQQIVRSASLVERLLGAGAIVWFYLWKAILPVHLAFIYPQWHISAADWHWWLPLAAALIVTGILWTRRETTSGRATLFAWAFFGIALLPVMGFVDITYMFWSLVADHYQHIALVAVAALAAAGLMQWRSTMQPSLRWLPLGAAAMAVIVLALLAARQSALYGDATLLYTAALRQNAECPMLYNNLGNTFAAQGRYDEAIESYRGALHVQSNNIEAMDNLGLALMNSGRKQEALSTFQNALQIRPDDPTVHSNLGTLLIDRGDLQLAAEHLRRAVEIQPDRAEYHNNLGTAYLRARNYQPAIAAYERALRLTPNFTAAQQGLLAALVKSGQTEKAIALFPEAFTLPESSRGAPAENRPSK